MSRIIDRTGERYGRWLVLGRGEDLTEPAGVKRVRWVCQCACGKVRLVKAASLSSGKSQSCGCLNIQKTKARNLRHGYTKLPEFKIWLGIKRRCFNPSFSAYPRYGGRGITLAPEWMDFAQFYKDLGPRPGRGYTIDRIDNTKGYEPGNCRWATYAEQNRNTSRTVWVNYNGRRMALVDAADEAGLSHTTVRGRRQRGWPEDLWFIPSTSPSTRSDRREFVPVIYRGKPYNVSQLARLKGIDSEVLRKRISMGWPQSRWFIPPTRPNRNKSRGCRLIAAT